MATHSSILSWKTTWTEESGRLQSYQSYKRLQGYKSYRVTRATGLQEPDTTEHTQTQLPNDCEGVFFYTFGYVNFT